ncbi:hypothetical protein GCM10022419_121760 [Nonomuraea rosea]|uniref:Uncharacterized protein n=1 Tax=Nonomuraea rosea TaxID=638574 RepID=A0ABP6ZQK7_9ACTN
MSASAQGSPAGCLAWELAKGLRSRGIATQVFESHGVALVGIWSVGLTVWCEWGRDAWRFRWSLSEESGTGRWDYTVCPCSAMATAVRRIEDLYQERYRRMYGAAALRAHHQAQAGEDGRG